VALAKESHFTQAATRCHISKSALPASIRSLERELGSGRHSSAPSATERLEGQS
jgi:hypothetical protein